MTDWARVNYENSAVRADLWTERVVLTEPRGRQWRLTVLQALALAKQLQEAAASLARQG